MCLLPISFYPKHLLLKPIHTVFLWLITEGSYSGSVQGKGVSLEGNELGRRLRVGSCLFIVTNWN